MNEEAVKDLRAMNIAINSLKYNPELADSIILQTVEDQLLSIRNRIESEGEE